MVHAMSRFNVPARLVAVLLTAAVLMLPLAGATPASAQSGDIPAADIDRYIAQQMAQTHIPGMAVAIVRGQDIVYLKGFGLASLRRHTAVSPQTIFDLASCSKSFTALAVLTLWHDSAIDLDSPVTTYLPEFHLHAEGVSREITVRELLVQTSGIPGTFAEPLAFHSGSDAMKQLVAAMSRIQAINTPGTSFEYSNLNYSLLGALVERVTGRPFEDYVQERVFAPLRMDNSTLRPEIAAGKDRADGHQLLLGKVVTRNIPIYRSMIPAGWIMSSAEDMGRWLIANLNAGMVDNAQVVPPELIRLMQTTASTFTKDGREAGYGMGWFTGTTDDGSPVLWHGGDTPNFLSEMILLPEQKLGVIMLANGQTTPDAHHIAIDIAGMVLGTKLDLPAAPWWASWKSIDNISISATILAIVLITGLIPYAWWQTHIVRRLRQKTQTPARRGRKIKVWWVVVPATPWMFFAILVSGAYAVFETLFGFNVFRIVARFGYFAPPGVIVAAVAIVVALFLWAIALSITTIFRVTARAR